MTDADRIRTYVQWEADGELSPAQVNKQFTPDQLEEVERLCAADLVMKARRVRELSGQWDDLTVAAYARAMEARALEFTAAAVYLRRRLENRDVPSYLRANGGA